MEPALPGAAARSRLAEIIRHLARSSRSPVDSPDHLDEAARLVADHLRRAGCHVEQDAVPFRGGHFDNVYGTLTGPGSGPPLILAAHHDSAPGVPDADDLSGLAVLLETARALADSAPEVPIVFASYTLENWGCAGSTHHVSRLAAGGEPILGMINLDSVGYASDAPGSQRNPALLRPFYPRRANFLSVVGNFASRPLLRSVARCLREASALRISVFHLPGRGFLVPELRSGDHAPFWDAGLPAVMVTDTAAFRNPHHHRPTDRPDTLNLPFLEAVTGGVAHVARNIARAGVTRQESGVVAAL
jgi:Zn-dependent M28 family amino/carboxypeptidase